MAARHASLTSRGEVLEIRDLDSPGGTFVNRQRILAGRARVLEPGDLVQLGAVQLQVRREADATTEQEQQPAAPAAVGVGPGQLLVPYTITGAGTCRTWDDFLTLSAQRWNLVRDELTSGRLAEHMKRLQRRDLVPQPQPRQNPDEQLDGWLARLPVSRSSAPELDVHPETLIVRSSTSGGLVRQTLRITNVGYRLLRGTVRVESPERGRIRVAASSEGDSFLTIDQTELLIEFELGDDVTRFPSGTSLGAVVIESNGGTKRIEVRLERPPRADLIPEAVASSSPINLMAWGRPLSDRVESLSLGRRLVLAPVCLVVLRLLVAIAGLIPTPFGAAAGPGELRLGAIGLLLAVAGLVAGLTWAARTGEARDQFRGPDLAAAGFAGGMIGLFAAAVCFAAIQSFESILGSWSRSLLATTVLWGGLGLGLALLSWIALPPRGTSPPVGCGPPLRKAGNGSAMEPTS
jgi:hypothetical protein